MQIRCGFILAFDAVKGDDERCIDCWQVGTYLCEDMKRKSGSLGVNLRISIMQGDSIMSSVNGLDTNRYLDVTLFSLLIDHNSKV